MPKDLFKISVRQLVEFVLQDGDLATGSFQVGDRMLEGTRGHQQVQKARPEGYQAEVPLRYEILQDDWRLLVSGRIDGLFPEENPIWLEEIKTTTLDLDLIHEDYNPLHWAQAKCYAYICAEQQDLTEVGIQLTYYHIHTQRMKEFRQVFSREYLAHFFVDLTTTYLTWAKKVHEWLQQRDTSIQGLEFPYPTYRQKQRDFAVAVYRAMQRQAYLFAQAPTGIGKTMATLFPAVKAVGTGLITKIFYLTAKTVGRTVAEKALDDMRESGLHLKSVTLTAKDKICFCPATARDGNSCEYAQNYYGKLREALSDAFDQDAFSRSTIEALAEKHQVCPFEFSLDLALWADCIICDYNYAFDPRVYLRRFFDQPKDRFVFLIDEAHNFPDRAREMFSATLEKQAVLALHKQIKDDLPKVARCLKKINQILLEKRRSCTAEGQSALAEKTLPETLLKATQKFVAEAEAWLSLNQPGVFRQNLLDFYFQCNAYLRVAEQFDSSYVSYFERRGKSDLAAKLFCLDPAPHLREALSRSEAVIFFSATLLPLDYFERVLTDSTGQPAIALPSPFPDEHFRLLIQNRISTKYAHRAASYQQIADTIQTVCAAQSGNYLVYFPSYVYMEAIVAILRTDAPDLKLLVQARSMDEAAREDFLAQFAATDSETLLGFAVMGGIFGEGIDLVGNRLIGAIIVGVGLPQLCLERDLIKDYFQAKTRQGFEYAYQYPGLNRVLQAAGRVIRTETDRGVIVLIDDRFTQSRYRTLFPENWQRYQAVPTTEDVRQALKRFW